MYLNAEKSINRPDTIFIMSVRLFVVIFICTSVLSIGNAVAQNDRSRAIYEDFDNKRSAVTYETSTIQMKIVDSRGRIREREMETWSYRKDNITKTLTRFLAPADVRGTGFLNIREGDNEVQRLFLPALNRVQTIASGQRGDRFMGSDFTYEDMGDQNTDDFEFETIREDVSTHTTVIKATRKNPSSYAYAHFLLDTKRSILLEASYFNASDELIRKLTAENHVEVKNGVWRSDKLTMRDIRNNRYTELLWKSRTLDEPISESVFTERNLSRF